MNVKRGVVLTTLSIFFHDITMKSLLLSSLLIVSSMVVHSTTDFNINCRNAFHDIICLRFADAHSKIDNEKQGNPSNSIPYLLDNYIDFLTVMIGEDQKDLEKMRDKRDFRLQHLVKGDRTSPWYLNSQAEIYLQGGFARIKFGEYLLAGIDINRAFRLLTENEKKFPGFIPDQIRLGLLHAFIGTVPDKYQWAVKALDFEGTISQGLGELRTAYSGCLNNKQYDFLLPETIFLLSFVSINLSGDKNVATGLSNEFNKPALLPLVSQSPLVCFAFANLKIKSGKNDEAIRILAACQQLPGSILFITWNT